MPATGCADESGEETEDHEEEKPRVNAQEDLQQSSGSAPKEDAKMEHEVADQTGQEAGARRIGDATLG